MTWKSLMLEKLRGGLVGRPLFVPRLDIWYHANRAKGTLPAELSGLSLRETVRFLGLGFHSVVPDFVRTGDESDIVHRGLGFYNNPDFPYFVDFGGVDYSVDRSASELKVVYRLPKGEITTRIEYGENFLKSGMSIPAILEHPIKKEGDYALLEELFSKVRIEPRRQGYEVYRNRVGDDGLAVCFVSLACGPFGHIQRDLRRMDEFFYDYYDFPRKIEGLAEVLGGLYEKMIASAAATDAEAAIFGANYDEMITIRPMFDKHFLPWLRKAGDVLRAAGKLVLTHTDGENEDLIESFLSGGFDIADSVTPAPMTKLTLGQYRERFAGKIAIWGGIPSVLMLEDSMGYGEFKAFVERLIGECRPHDKLVYSIADTCPPQASYDRLEYLCERLNP